MRGLFAAIFFFFTSYTFSQAVIETGRLKGHVIAEGEKMELASVILLKTTFTATTDNKGDFDLKGIPVGKYQLRVTYVGYENFQQEVIIKPGQQAEVKAELIPLASNLKETVITGSLKEVSKLQSITPIDVYTSKFFLRNPTSNVWEAIGNVNGIYSDVDQGVSNTNDVQINGLEGNYTMILIDGVPSMNGLAGIYTLNALPLSNIDKIEVLKGASSSVYGSGAIAGVINIITKDPANTPRFAANVELTSKLETVADLSASFKIKKVSSIISLSLDNSNYRWDINDDNFMDNPLTNRVAFFNKWSVERKDKRIATVYARYLFEDRFGGQVNTPGHLTGSDQYYTEWIRTNQWQAGFQYQLPVKEKVLLSADYSEHYQQAWFGLSNYKGLQRTAFAQITWNKQVDKVNGLLFGASYRLKYYSDNTGLSNDSVTGIGNYLHVGGIFLEDELTLAVNHKLLIGSRFEYNNSSGPVATPRMIYKWNSLNEKNIIRISLGTGYRTPNLLNDGFGALNGSRKIVVAEKLKSEYAVTSCINYTRVQELTGGLLNLDFSAFYTYFTNYINPDYSQPGLIVYANTKGGAMAPGFSGNADFTFNYPLKVGVGFTYVNVFEINIADNGQKEREQTQHSPPLIAQFYFSYNFPVPQLSLDWTGNLISPMLLSTVPNDFRPSHSTWYTIQNIQVTKKFKNGIEIYAGIKNLFNFIQKDPILRPNDPFNRTVTVNNPYNYMFDTTYGFMSMEGIKGFVGFRYTML